MLRFIMAVVIVGVTIYAAIDCLRTPGEQVRTLPKPAWLVIILVSAFFGALGSIAYLVFGRPRPEPGHGPGGQGRVRRGPAPDDDPEFLRSLDLERERDRNRPDEGENKAR